MWFVLSEEERALYNVNRKAAISALRTLAGISPVRYWSYIEDAPTTQRINFHRAVALDRQIKSIAATAIGPVVPDDDTEDDVPDHITSSPGKRKSIPSTKLTIRKLQATATALLRPAATE